MENHLLHLLLYSSTTAITPILYNTVKRLCMGIEYLASVTRYFDYDLKTHNNEADQTYTLPSQPFDPNTLKNLENIFANNNILHSPMHH